MVIIANLIIGFFAAFVNRFITWLLVAHLTGALKVILISATTMAAITILVFTLMAKANALILQALQGMAMFSPSVMGLFASFLPPSLGTCFGIIVSCYLTAIVYNFAKEIIRIKARLAERAAGFFKA